MTIKQNAIQHRIDWIRQIDGRRYCPELDPIENDYSAERREAVRQLELIKAMPDDVTAREILVACYGESAVKGW